MQLDVGGAKQSLQFGQNGRLFTNAHRQLDDLFVHLFA